VVVVPTLQGGVVTITGTAEDEVEVAGRHARIVPRRPC
jgi:hypothetical protein